MTVTALPANDQPSALDVYVEELRQRDLRDLIRAVLRLAQSTELSEDQASVVLESAGITVTQVQVEDAVLWLDDLDNPNAAAERGMPEGFDGNLDEAAYRLRDLAQGDLDTLIDVAVRCAPIVGVGTAVLGAVNALVTA